MALKVLAADGVKIYNLSSGKSLPEWVSEKKQRKNKRASNDDQHIELLQDFNFPSSANKVLATPNGDCLVAIGNYPPQVRLFDVGNLSSKVTRHVDSQIVDLEILSDDYSKLAFVCSDRTVKFHARFGHYHETRIPLDGRDLTYIPFLAQLLVAGSNPELHRIDLYEGKFQEPIQTTLESINSTDLSTSHGLVACGGSNGYLSCIDLRQKTPIRELDISHLLERDCVVEITSVKFDNSGLQLATGTSDGLIALFDLRSHRPVVIKEHCYDSQIHSLHFLDAQHKTQRELSNKIASADRFVVKIWDSNSGDTYTNVEPRQNCGINHLAWWRDSGLFFLACDDPRIQSYFIPSLGTAPNWCAFLDNMTEELEEDSGHALYDDYKFVTEKDLIELGLRHLIGTDLLKAYMHGYFIQNKLYLKAKLINQPPVQKKPELADERISAVRTISKSSKKGLSLFNEEGEVRDERFKAVLENPAFKIDPNHNRIIDDSLLVPKDSVVTLTSVEETLTIDEDMIPLEDRSKSLRQRKKTRIDGPTEFHFIPKSKQKKRFNKK